MTAYDDANIFARILRGEIPAHRIYEDDRTVAIMDVMPQVEGHALVLPKAPSRNLLAILPEDLAAVMATVQKIALAAVPAFDAEGVTIQQFNEAAGGQTVFHTHVHVLPRKAGIPVKPHSGVMAPGELLAAHAEAYRRALASV
jgi:histidine triad (HIT) family protein